MVKNGLVIRRQHVQPTDPRIKLLGAAPKKSSTQVQQLGEGSRAGAPRNGRPWCHWLGDL